MHSTDVRADMHCGGARQRSGLRLLTAGTFLYFIHACMHIMYVSAYACLYARMCVCMHTLLSLKQLYGGGAALSYPTSPPS